MKKITSLFAVVSVYAASSAAFAMNGSWSESDLFAGISAGYAKTKVQVEGVPGEDKSDSTGFFNLHFGSFFLQDEARAYITFGYNKPKDAHWSGSQARVSGIKQMNLLASADYLFMPESQIQPFLGLTIGTTRTKANGYQLVDTTGKSLGDGSFSSKWSFSYGAQGGVIYKIDNFDLEAGLRYLTNSTSHHYREHHHVKLKVNDSRQIYVAASYHF